MIRVLFVDDDVQAHRTLRMVLEDGHTVLSAYTGAQGVAMVRGEDPDVVLLDVRLPDRSGLDVLRDILAIPLPPAVVMISAYTQIPMVVEAIRSGAHDFMAKPYDLKQLLGTLRHAALARATSSAPRGVGAEAAVAAIIGASPAIERVRRAILRYGRSGFPVMIRGESGTGKELVARALHAVSGRRGAFLAMNCGALPETLVESEIFGTERGAFTDAPSRAGAFEQAHEGTLFLDEIGEMAQSAQAKLLRILEQKEVTRLGATASRFVDVRVLSASLQDLSVGSGVLREDLYYRIGVLRIDLPPLRDRPEDIPLLSAAFLREAPGAHGTLRDAALERLAEHAWPGNVRELRNVLARAVVLADGAPVGPECIQFL